jgi:hypothetical protein
MRRHLNRAGLWTYDAASSESRVEGIWHGPASTLTSLSGQRKIRT